MRHWDTASLLTGSNFLCGTRISNRFRAALFILVEILATSLSGIRQKSWAAQSVKLTHVTNTSCISIISTEIKASQNEHCTGSYESDSVDGDGIRGLTWLQVF